jgi:thiamine kinase-like enzyme
MDADSDVYTESYPEAWAFFLEKSGHGMPEALFDVGERLGRHVPALKARLAQHPLTMVHGDYRLDNCFLGHPGDRRSLVVFDWEFCSRGRGVYDAATFICEALPPEQRKREEMELLELYHSTLLENRVRDYSFAQCLEDYRLSMLEVFVFWVVVGGYCDFEGERATTYLHNALARFNAAIADLGSAELLLD